MNSILATNLNDVLSLFLEKRLHEMICTENVDVIRKNTRHSTFAIAWTKRVLTQVIIAVV
jgi:hypothetical protein